MHDVDMVIQYCSTVLNKYQVPVFYQYHAKSLMRFDQACQIDSFIITTTLAAC